MADIALLESFLFARDSWPSDRQLTTRSRGHNALLAGRY